MSEKIKFSELVANIALETGAPKRVIRDMLAEMVGLTKEGLNRDGYVNLGGLGRFTLKWHEARAGRNPRTGEAIDITARNSVYFKAEAALRKHINRAYAHLSSDIVEAEITEEPAESAQPEKISEHELKMPKPTPSPPAPVVSERKSGSLKWLWLIVPAIIIVLLFVFWPDQKEQKALTDETVAANVVEEAVPVQEEEIEPVEILSEEATPVQQRVTAQPEAEPVVEEVVYEIPGGNHIIKSGDKLWTVSQDFYKQGYLWPNIYRVNVSEISNPDLLKIGEEILVPPLRGKPGNLTEKDIEEIAEGFMEVYLTYKRSGNKIALNYLWVVRMLKINSVIDRYRERIKIADLESVDKIEGTPVIR